MVFRRFADEETEDSVKRTWNVTLMAFLTGAVVLDCAGQTLNYSINGGTAQPVPASSDINIDVTPYSGTVLIRIWDPVLVSGLPNDDVRRITISGSTPTELQLLIAPPSVDWPDYRFQIGRWHNFRATDCLC